LSPKGFASVVYGRLALESRITDAQLVFDLAAVTIVLSIALHSSTDVPVAHMLRIKSPDNLPGRRTEAELTDLTGETLPSTPDRGR
jgi:sodium/hydrogen antiporter